MDNTERFIPVQICYAEPENQILIDLEVPENTRLIDALNLSCLLYTSDAADD